MSAETVGMHMPSVVTLDDLAAMIAADLHGHRYRDPAQTVTLYHLAHTGQYEVVTKLPLAWMLNTAPADHLD